MVKSSSTAQEEPLQLSPREMSTNMDSLSTLASSQGAPSQDEASTRTASHQEGSLNKDSSSSSGASMNSGNQGYELEQRGSSSHQQENYSIGSSSSHDMNVSYRPSPIQGCQNQAHAHEHQQGSIVNQERLPPKNRYHPAPSEGCVGQQLENLVAPPPPPAANPSILSSKYLEMIPSGNPGDLVAPSKICPPSCTHRTSCHPDLFDYPARYSNNQLRIVPLTKDNAYHILKYQAGRHCFFYYPDTEEYLYWGRISFLDPKAKHERLYSLLADYVHGLLDCIADRHLLTHKQMNNDMSPDDEENIVHIAETKALLHSLRGHARPLATKAFPRRPARDLRTWHDKALYEKYKTARYYDYFKFMEKESVWEMFALLMDEECREIREVWDEVFAAHVLGTDGVADIFQQVEYEDRWKRGDDWECAWRWFDEGKFEDLVVVYEVGEVHELVFDRGYRYEGGCEVFENESEDEFENDYEVDDDETLEEWSSSSPSTVSSTPTNSSPSPSPSPTSGFNSTASSSGAGKAKTTARTKNKGKGKAVDRTVATGRVQKGKEKATPMRQTPSTTKTKTKATQIPRIAEPANKKRKEPPCEPTVNDHVMETRRKKKGKHVYFRSSQM